MRVKHGAYVKLSRFTHAFVMLQYSDYNKCAFHIYIYVYINVCDYACVSHLRSLITRAIYARSRLLTVEIPRRQTGELFQSCNILLCLNSTLKIIVPADWFNRFNNNERKCRSPNLFSSLLLQNVKFRAIYFRLFSYAILFNIMHLFAFCVLVSTTGCYLKQVQLNTF